MTNSPHEPSNQATHMCQVLSTDFHLVYIHSLLNKKWNLKDLNQMDLINQTLRFH